MMKKTILFLLLVACSIPSIAQTLEESEWIRKASETPERQAMLKKMQAHQIEFEKQRIKNNWPIFKFENGDSLILVNFDKSGPIYESMPVPLTSWGVKGIKADKLHPGGIMNLDVEGTGFLMAIFDAYFTRHSHRDFENPNNTSESRVGLGPDIGLPYTWYSTGCGFNQSHPTYVASQAISSAAYDNGKHIGIAPNASAITTPYISQKKKLDHIFTSSTLPFAMVSNHSYGNLSSRMKWECNSFVDSLSQIYPYHTFVFGSANATHPAPSVQQVEYKNAIAVGEVGYFSNTAVQLPINQQRERYRVTPLLTMFNLGNTADNAHDADYDWIGSGYGTSFVAPQISAAVILLQEVYRNYYPGFMKSATVRALLVNSALDIDVPGPDKERGFGKPDLEVAAEIIQEKDRSTLIIEDNLSSSSASFTRDVWANSNGDPIQVTLAWDEKLGFKNDKDELSASDNNVLLNDLDLRVEAASGLVHYPWRFDFSNTSNIVVNQGDNTQDNIEKVEISNPIPNQKYTITVNSKWPIVKWYDNGTNSYKVSSDQDFSLVVSTISPCDTSVPYPSGVVVTQPVTTSQYAHANDFILKNEISGTNTFVEYTAAVDIICQDGFYAHNDDTWLHIQDCHSPANIYKPVARSPLYFADPCTSNSNSYVEDELQSRTKDDADRSGALSLFPNPSSGSLTVGLPVPSQGHWQVLDVRAAVLAEDDFPESTQLEIILSDRNLADGIYFLKIHTDRGQFFEKFILQSGK